MKCDRRVSSQVTLAFVAVAYILSPTPLSPQSSPSSVVARIENGPNHPAVLVLTDGTRFQTQLFQVRVLGALPAVGKMPYLVLAGRGCTDCDANISIYIHSPSDGPMRDEAKQPRYSYPGREFYYEDRSPLYVGRMFIGNCLNRYPNAVVWHQRTRTDSGQLVPSVFIVSAGPDSLTETWLRDRYPPLAQSLGHVRSGACKEIAGVDRSSEP